MHDSRVLILLVATAIAVSLPIDPSFANSGGKAMCGKIDAENQSTTSISKATLASRNGGYQLKLVRNGGTEVLDLDRQLFVTGAKTEGKADWNLVSYKSDPTPVKIDRRGKFGITMMVSTRSVCEFDGTLTFIGTAKTQLFGSSNP